MRTGLTLVIFCAAFFGSVHSASAQAGGQKCGSFGWNLEGCDCKGATGSCSIDPSGQGCSASQVPAGAFPIAYANIGRCDSDCPAGGIGRGGLKASEGGWNEPWINLKSGPGKARTQRLIEQAARKGFKAIEPDNTAEKVDVADLLFIVQTAAHYGMKVTIKNDEGTWKQFLSQYPNYKQNINMVLAEDCNSSSACSHYKHFKDLGIPVVITGQNAGALQSLAKQIPAAGMVVPAKNAVGKTTIGEPPCIDTTPPKQEAKPSGAGDYVGQSQGQQPYQQAAQGGGQGSQSQPSPATGGGGGPATKPTGVYNPGAGPWKKSDFDKLQKEAKPSFLDPGKQLPKDGKKNPFAAGDSWKDEKKEEEKKKPAAEQKKKEEVSAKKEESTTFYDPLGGVTTQVKKSDEEKVNKKITVPKSFGDAKIQCSPDNVLRGARPLIRWKCGSSATKSSGARIDTRGMMYGSTRVFPIKTTTYAVNCYKDDEMIGSAQCTVRVRTDKPSDAAFSTGEPAKSEEEKKSSSLCFLSFCL